MNTKNLPKEAELKLNAIFEAATDGIITIDKYGIVESINPAGANLFGYTKDEVIGNNIKMLMPSPYHESHDGYIQNYLDSGIPKIIGVGREVQGLKKNGTIFPIRLAVSEVSLQNGRHLFTGIIHDLTVVKKAEEKIVNLNRELSLKKEELEIMVAERTEKLASVVDKLLELNEQLGNEIQEKMQAEKTLKERERELELSLEKEKELNALKSRFVSMASHEFRTPLSTILSSIELVEAYDKEVHSDKRSKHINRIKTSVKNLTEILKDFLSLSRLEEGKITTEPENFLFSEFCSDVLDELGNLLKHGQKFIYENKIVDQEVFLDKKILRNILINLISNAIKYSDEGKPIHCKTEIENNQLLIDIADQGKGIPEEDQVHLFTRFFRARNVENIQGTGLGLNIVKRYLDLLNGTISFKSKEGIGTTFYISIPLLKN